MKKIIVAACVAIASAVAIADAVQSDNTFGVLKITTGNPQNASEPKQFIIPIPWDAVGGDSGGIMPKKLVLSSNLQAGDMLYEYGSTESGKFGAWTLSVDGGEWTAAGVDAKGETFVTGGDTKVKRGYGLIVETKAQEIYLSGQYATGGTITIPANSQTLISGGAAADCYLYRSSGSSNVTFTPEAGDEIFVVDPVSKTNDKYYKYVNGLWRTPPSSVISGGMPSTEPDSTIGSLVEATEVKIPQGFGAWYSSKASVARTLTFN